MEIGEPSVTARRVAAYRSTLDRLEAPFGDPATDDRLARDVAGAVTLEENPGMARYLAARTRFFDRVVVGAVEGGMDQVVSLGAGYDGRAWRYGRPGVRWWEVDHPATQADKRRRLEHLGADTASVSFVAFDLTEPGLAAALTAAGLSPDRPWLGTCEGVAVYLEAEAVERVLAELRSVAGLGSELALSVGTASRDEAARDRFRRRVAAAGEPAQSDLRADNIADLLDRTGWRRSGPGGDADRAGLLRLQPS